MRRDEVVCSPRFFSDSYICIYIYIYRISCKSNFYSIDIDHTCTRAVSYRLYEFYTYEFTYVLTPHYLVLRLRIVSRNIYIYIHDISFFLEGIGMNVDISHTDFLFFFFPFKRRFIFSFLFDNKFVYNLSYRLVRLEVLVGGGGGEDSRESIGQSIKR